MSTSVYRGNQQIESYQFGELLPKRKDAHKEDESGFELQSLDQFSDMKNGISQDLIRKEREHESKSTFSIDETVRKHRGITEQERQDYENSVRKEVEKRVDALKEQAYQEGFDKGKELGFDEAHKEASVAFDQKVQFLEEQFKVAINQIESIYDKSKLDAYSMVRNLSKWVVLKEIDEKKYLERLLEKLILEIKTKNNLLIRVNQSVFEDMPEIIENVQERIGKLTNARVEVEMDMERPGIILESENGIIDGSLEAQFASIDKLFESVGLNGSDRA